jgi:mannosyltransferase
MISYFYKPITFLRTHRKLDFVFLLTAVTVFSTVTLFNITNAAIWFDEAFSSYLIQFSFKDIFFYTATDVHPPLYYWALKAWTLLFGTGEFGLRSMSMLFAIATIVMTFILTRRLFGRKVALISLLFLTLSPLLVRYADEARMYTMAAFIVVTATYALVRAVDTQKRRWWVVYGVLIGLGMWTHYFTALIWLAHWAWRGWLSYKEGSSLKQRLKHFFSRNWILAHIVGIAVFSPWIYFMIRQLGIVQAGGFWIGPVGVDTPVNFLTNVFYYLEHGQVQSFVALTLLVILVLIIPLLFKTYKSLNQSEKSHFMLVAMIAWVPGVLLFLASLPPLRPSYVERYLIPAVVMFMVLLAVVFVVGTKKWRPIWRALPIMLIASMMVFGVANVYKYGNYNKNTNVHIVTREVIHEVQKVATDGQPIIATSPWLFYESIPYATAEHPIYFIDADTEYIYGSLDMLRTNDMHKIKDLDAFAKQHPTIWYLGQDDNGDVDTTHTSWDAIRTVIYTDPLTNKADYRATEYRISAE